MEKGERNLGGNSTMEVRSRTRQDKLTAKALK